MDTNPHHSVRRIILPSGRAIEVVRFHESSDVAPAGLHECPRCDSDLVQPIEWNEAGEDSWELTLECPNCWWQEDGVFGRDQVAALEEHLDTGLTAVLDDLRRLSQANMSEQVDRFVSALQADLILPEDF